MGHWLNLDRAVWLRPWLVRDGDMYGCLACPDPDQKPLHVPKCLFATARPSSRIAARRWLQTHWRCGHHDWEFEVEEPGSD